MRKKQHDRSPSPCSHDGKEPNKKVPTYSEEMKELAKLTIRRKVDELVPILKSEIKAASLSLPMHDKKDGFYYVHLDVKSPSLKSYHSIIANQWNALLGEEMEKLGFKIFYDEDDYEFNICF